MREEKLLCLQAVTGEERGWLRWADIWVRGTLSQRSQGWECLAGACWFYHRLHLSRNQGGGQSFLQEKNWEDLLFVGDQSVSSCLCLPPKHQAPIWFWTQVISFSIVLNFLLLFVFTNVHAISSMGKPTLANESWAAKAKLSDECKMEFYIIMHFIIIMMNCDCFPGKKWQCL